MIKLVRFLGALSASATVSLTLVLPMSAQARAKPGSSYTSFSRTPLVLANRDAGTETVRTSPKQETDMELLFTATLKHRSDKIEDAVVANDDREGVYISTADGKAVGQKLNGTISTSMFSGNCPYPAMRNGAPAPEGLHLCTVNRGGFIDTKDGAHIRFDAKGYGLSTPEKYRVSTTIVFATEDPRYQWLTHVLGVMEGEVDVKAGGAIWNVYVPKS